MNHLSSEIEQCKNKRYKMNILSKKTDELTKIDGPDLNFNYLIIFS